MQERSYVNPYQSPEILGAGKGWWVGDWGRLQERLESTTHLWFELGKKGRT